MGDYAIVPNVPARTLAEPDRERAALRAVLRRYETGQDTAAQTRTVLQLLGMADTPPEPDAGPAVREREARRLRRQRQKARERGVP